jgi:hypothetical protein
MISFAEPRQMSEKNGVATRILASPARTRLRTKLPMNRNDRTRCGKDVGKQGQGVTLPVHSEPGLAFGVQEL